ncbi:MAG: Exported protein [Lachnoclostridium sp.]|jgi:hypothetical protein
MNELLLIDMMSELDPALLEDDYMEKDMKREKIPFFKRLLNFKTAKQSYEFPEKNPMKEHITADNDFVMAENIHFGKLDGKSVQTEESGYIRGFQISIFRKKLHRFFKILSGIAATVIVLSSIVLILLKRHKGSSKLRTKKIQLNHI